jgi:hypothetical protein
MWVSPARPGEVDLTNIMQVGRNVDIRNGEVTSLINPSQGVVIVRVNTFGAYANYHEL